MQDTVVFEEHRRLLFGLAYRLLGSVVEAEDMVQETYLRWQRRDVEVKSAKSYLSSIVTRLCIDRLRQISRRREDYIGVWLPEPLLETGTGADTSAELADSLSTAFIVLLDALPPVDRAVYLLREVFGYEYSEISDIVEKTEANCRQMVSRAKEKLASRRPATPHRPGHSEKLVHSFLQACEKGDLSSLLSLLTENAVMYSDGGGQVRAAIRPIVGADKIARFFLGIRKFADQTWEVRFAKINQTPSALVYVDGKLIQTMVFEFTGEKLQNLYIMRNPEKLRHLAGVAVIKG